MLKVRVILKENKGTERKGFFTLLKYSFKIERLEDFGKD
jgi:hypothetical protein